MSKHALQIIGWWACGLLFLVLWLAAMAIPPAIWVVFGTYWAALGYFVVALFWVIIMPCTCMDGGLVSSLAAMPIVLPGMLVPVIALCKFIIQILPKG